LALPVSPGGKQPWQLNQKGGWTMKRIAWAALAATACLALLAGKDDIRRFYRMCSM